MKGKVRKRSDQIDCILFAMQCNNAEMGNTKGGDSHDRVMHLREQNLQLAQDARRSERNRVICGNEYVAVR